MCGVWGNSPTTTIRSVPANRRTSYTPALIGCSVVVCDSIRLRWDKPALHSKIAPASLPLPAANWLKQLAQAIEDAGAPRPAAALRAGLEQFAAR